MSDYVCSLFGPTNIIILMLRLFSILSSDGTVELIFIVHYGELEQIRTNGGQSETILCCSHLAGSRSRIFV